MTVLTSYRPNDRKWPQQTCLQPCESWLIFLADDSLIYFSRYKIISITGRRVTGVLDLFSCRETYRKLSLVFRGHNLNDFSFVGLA